MDVVVPSFAVETVDLAPSLAVETVVLAPSFAVETLIMESSFAVEMPVFCPLFFHDVQLGLHACLKHNATYQASLHFSYRRYAIPYLVHGSIKVALRLTRTLNCFRDHWFFAAFLVDSDNFMWVDKPS
ncbi:hypothetical protein PsorP6_011655 [Peronosclerospora sorghi]|uniref:Uncharacterized protein n=1 Tax=Peronosclerospora sorghi TaxID=230839 RepID=A0ACC0WIH8_9STRA|nr:hypothetical protein PsorP6_011655 [Peronosclerospora sorghi]